jgi:hypothetical protein
METHRRGPWGTPGCLPALGPERCPWPTPWGLLRRSSWGGNGPQGTPGPLSLSRGPTYTRSANLPRMAHRARLRLYQTVPQLEGALLRLEERNHVSIMGPGARTAN